MHIDSPTPRPAFLASERDQYGLSRYAVHRGSVEKPFHGVLALPREHPRRRMYQDELLAERAAFFATKMKPHSAFSHVTALALHGCPIVLGGALRDEVGHGGGLRGDGVLRGDESRRGGGSRGDGVLRRDSVQDDELLHVTVPFEASRPRERGVVGHRSRAAFSVLQVRGLPVVSPFTALLQSSTMLSELELIVAADHFITQGAGGTTVELERLRRLASETSAGGAKRLRRALEHARVGAESRYETLLRLELVHRGFTDLEPQFVIHDDAGFVGRFDLVSRRRLAIFEYDGQQHRTNHRQYITDMQRLDRARLLGYRVLRFHFDDFAVGSRAIGTKLAQFDL